jgi:2-polyprenyl-3-methyl-5-hydroxy-6-metoxy-1,4-benzoquinol methylase
MATDPIGEHFDHKVCGCGALAPDGDLLPLTERLLAELDREGLAGRTVLEAGCGRGGLLVAMLRRGAASAAGIDLSREALTATGALAAAAGVGERCSTQLGDAAEAELPVHDVVVLDRVICCYPDPDVLLGNTLPAARSTYAFVVPVAHGWRGAAARLALGAEDLLRVVRGDPFRTFVHDTADMDRMLTGAGFALATRVVRGLWELRIYHRAGAG